MKRSRPLTIPWLLGGLLSLVSTPASAGGLTFVEYEQDPPGNVVVNGLNGAIAVAVSPDGEHVYVAGRMDDSISVWSRDPGDGQVTFAALAEHGEGTPPVEDMRRPVALAMSADGACLYVTAELDDSVVVFSRSALTGELTFVESHVDGDPPLDGLNGPSAVAVSADDLHVYVTGELDDAVSVFSRSGCALTLVESLEHGEGSPNIDGLQSPVAVTVSPDGDNVYVAAKKTFTDFSLGTVAVFSRNVGTGALTFVEFKQDGEVNGERLSVKLGDLIVSQDGANLYATSTGGSAVVVFERDTIDGTLAYLETQARGGRVQGIAGAAGIELSSDGRYAYVAGDSDGAIAVFSRNTTTGALRFLEYHDDPVPGLNVLGRAIGVAGSPDGSSVYVAAFGPNTLAVFHADICGDGSVGVDEQCDDDNTDDDDGCSGACRLELCGPTITGSCHAANTPRGASIKIKQGDEDRRDQLKWNWRGSATPLAQFGDPTAAASYVLCIYDSSADPQPLLSNAATAGGTCGGSPCWRAKSTGYQYSDRLLTPDGLKKVQLKEGLTDGRAKVQVQGAGVFLATPELPLTLPVTVQLKNTQNSECWQATFNAFRLNEAGEFSGKSD